MQSFIITIINIIIVFEASIGWFIKLRDLMELIEWNENISQTQFSFRSSIILWLYTLKVSKLPLFECNKKKKKKGMIERKNKKKNYIQCNRLLYFFPRIIKFHIYFHVHI